jgi:hypothetical protein
MPNFKKRKTFMIASMSVHLYSLRINLFMTLWQSKTFLMLVEHEFFNFCLSLVIKISDWSARVYLSYTDLWFVSKYCFPPSFLNFLQVHLDSKHLTTIKALTLSAME